MADDLDKILSEKASGDLDAILSGQGSLRAPTFWENARMAGSGALEKAGLPAHGARNISEFVIPGSNTEAGIQAGLAAMPGAGKVGAYAASEASPLVRAIVERLSRYAAPALGGALGGNTEGRPGTGAAQGAATGALGDVLPMLTKGLGRVFGSGGVQKSDVANVGKAVSAANPSLPPMASAEDMYLNAFTSKGKESLSKARQAVLDDIEQRLTSKYRAGSGAPGVQSFSIPSLQGVSGQSLLTPKEALHWMERLADKGWLESQAAARGPSAFEARAIRGKAKQELVAALNAQQPGLGDELAAAQGQYAKGLTYLNLLKQRGVLEDGKLNMNALRDALTKTKGKQTLAQQVESRSTANEVDAFYKALNRGGPMSGRDVPGSLGIHGSVGPTGVPHVYFSRPNLPQFTGPDVPWAYRPGVPSGGTPISFGLLGLTRQKAPQEDE